jgi:hypothetical protein
MHAAGARVEGDDRLAIYVAETLAGRTLANLRANGQAALTATRVTDNRSVQLKGTYVGDRPADAQDLARLESMQENGNHELALIGFPRSVLARLVDRPCVVVELRVREIFEQTPGPRAGQPLEGEAARG